MRDTSRLRLRSSLIELAKGITVYAESQAFYGKNMYRL